MRRFPILALAFVLLALSLPLRAQDRIPGERWMRYAAPEQAGWDPDRLEEARERWDSLSSSAFLVVENGIVVVAWGNVDRRYMCHSMRKSLMAGMYGIHVDAGTIDIERDMAELGIDDEPTLTDEEKTARIVDLLRARSGVYRLAAYEPPQNPKPPRGSHPPGTNWCYNNWDFNTLVTIFDQETGTKFFEEFGKRFADPLGMQDYRARDGYYHYEPDKSIHPAYPFRMSARDLARFGLLFLYDGAWGDERILSEQWVKDCRTSYSDSGTGGYGYMWWIYHDPRVRPHGMYSALGFGGHAVDVLPGMGLVVVTRVDTYRGKQVGGGDRLDLISLVLQAKVGEGEDDLKLVPLEETIPDRGELSREQLEALVGSYTVFGVGAGEISLEGNTPVAEIPSLGSFAIFPVEGSIMWAEDSEVLFSITPPAEGKPGNILMESVYSRPAEALAGAGDTDGALEMLERGLETFPMSPTLHVVMAEVVRSTGDPTLARALCETALELDPENEEARDLLRRIGDR